MRVQADRIRTVQIGMSGAAADQSSRAWDSPHAAADGEEAAEQALMMTGDNNLVEVQASVRYRIAPGAVSTYLFEVQDADKVIRATTESVLRGLVASRPLTDLLTTGRRELQAEACRQVARGGPRRLRPATHAAWALRGYPASNFVH